MRTRAKKEAKTTIDEDGTDEQKIDDETETGHAYGYGAISYYLLLVLLVVAALLPILQVVVTAAFSVRNTDVATCAVRDERCVLLGFGSS